MMSKRKWDSFWKESKFPLSTRLGFGFEERAIKSLFEKLNLDKNTKIVDLGCGQGRTLSYIRNMGFRNSFGVDSSEEALYACERRGFEIGKDVFLMSSRKADVLFSQGLLEHYLKKDWKPIIKSMVDTGAKTIILMQPLTKSLTFRAIKRLNGFTLQENEYDYELLDYMVAFDKFYFELKFAKTTHNLPKYLDTSMFMVFEATL